MKPRHLTLTLWAAFAVVAAAVYVYMHAAPLQPGAPNPERIQLHRDAAGAAQILFLLTVTSPLPFMLAAFSGLKNDSNAAFWVRVAILASLPWIAFITARRSTWPFTVSALEHAAQQAQPLIAAIERHRIVRGTPPEDLGELAVEIPGTNLQAYPNFRYVRRGPAESKQELWWYDLGPRSGRSQTSRWRSADGNLSHAVLVVRVAGTGTIEEMFADRMPIRNRNTEFNKTEWQTAPDKRLNGVSNLLEEHAPSDRTELLALLGEPDGKRTEVNAPWELRLATSPSELGDDPMRMNFFYWPSQAYPPHIDGVPVRRIGDWAYLLR